jgi:hypothetical protein
MPKPANHAAAPIGKPIRVPHTMEKSVTRNPPPWMTALRMMVIITAPTMPAKNAFAQLIFHSRLSRVPATVIR